MVKAFPFIAISIALASVVATSVVAAFLLRNSVDDVSRLASQLPTRLVRDDSSETREANRRTALSELTWLLAIRTIPGIILVVCSMGLLIYATIKLFGLAASAAGG